MNDHERFEILERQVRALIENENNFVANAGNFAALIAQELPDVNWAGFYLAEPSEELVLGPFSGRPACTRIEKGRGVCGAAAQKRETLVVDDVSTFADHIVCDSASRSEIVVPILLGQRLFGVFDIDSTRIARFTPGDRAGIERLVSAFAESLRPQP